MIGAMAINSAEQEQLNKKSEQELSQERLGQKEITQEQETNQEQETVDEEQEEFNLSNHGDGSPEDNIERTIEPKNNNSNL